VSGSTHHAGAWASKTPFKVPEVEGGPLAGRSLRSTIKAHGVGSKTVQRISRVGITFATYPA
jgi:hypothetical protein